MIMDVILTREKPYEFSNFTWYGSEVSVPTSSRASHDLQRSRSTTRRVLPTDRSCARLAALEARIASFE